MDLQDIFISNLKRFRKERGLTQEKLAELCETETSYIGQIETRKRFPSLVFIEKIADKLKVEPYQLFKPVEEIDSCKFSDVSLEIQNELLLAISDDIAQIFARYR